MKFKIKYFLISLPVLIGASFVFHVNFSRASCSSSEISQMIKESESCNTLWCYTSILNRLENCKTEVQEKKERAAEETAVLQQKVNELGASISQKNASIASLNAQISNLQYKINKLNQEIEETEKKMKKNRQRIKTAIKSFYEYDHENIITIVLSKGSISNFFDEVFYVGSIEEEISSIVKDLKESKKILQKNKKELAVNKELLEANRNKLASEMNILAQEKAEQDRLLGSAQGELLEYTELNQEIVKKTQEIYKQISGMMGGSCGIPLKWPFDSHAGTFTQGYGCLHTEWARGVYPSCDGGKGGFHNGVDIGIPCGTPIKASANGTIVGSGNYGDSAYGLWLVVKYDNGLYVLYAHLSSINASGNVTEGQTLALSGNTGLSTGCHLHLTAGKSLFGGLPSINSCGPSLY